MTTIRTVIAQLNFTVGDIDGNLKKHREAIASARELKASLIIFPECSLVGYPPEDLLFRKTFFKEADKALTSLVETTKDIYCLVGLPVKKNKQVHNAAVLFYNGNILATYYKERLPNYSVFDELRYFDAGDKPSVAMIDGVPIGIIICEDLWSDGPMSKAVANGAKAVIAINASPFVFNKHDRRRKMLRCRSTETHTPIIYACGVGGQDELVFDGDSMVIDSNGELVVWGGFFDEKLIPFDIHYENNQIEIISDQKNINANRSPEEKIYNALVLAVKDYVNKNHIPGVLIGVSGGIDSAVSLAIAVDALGKDRVRALIMPSRFTSELSRREANAVTQNLGVSSETISIEPMYAEFLKSLQLGKTPSITEENLQARCRAVMLMARSNQTNYVVLSTGNRSELAVGYCTIYGDMAGGYNVLRDVYKTQVFKLARYRNSINPVIPETTITRAPSAELAENQKDEDSLPPYSILDQILIAYMDLGQSIEEITLEGFDRDTVNKVVALIRKSEYKRKQGAPGPRVHRNSFGRAWRYPITNGFKK